MRDPEDRFTSPTAHPWRPERDAALADDVVTGLVPWGDGEVTVPSFVPVRDGHGVAQVLHRWDTDGGDEPGSTWREVAADLGTTRQALAAGSMAAPPFADVTRHAPPLLGSLDRVTAQRLVELLAPATTDPDDVLAIVWAGWGDLPRSSVRGAASVPDPNHTGRDGLLLRGPLDGLTVPLGAVGGHRGALLWWPADRAWVAACEIDLPWTYVCGPPALVASLVDDDVVEAVAVSKRAAGTELGED